MSDQELEIFNEDIRNSFPEVNRRRYDMDAHYAINKYNYEKVGRKIIISDKYDYTEKASCKPIAGVAINFMYELERRGLAVPYYVNTTLYY